MCPKLLWPLMAAVSLVESVVRLWGNCRSKRQRNIKWPEKADSGSPSSPFLRASLVIPGRSAGSRLFLTGGPGHGGHRYLFASRSVACLDHLEERQGRFWNGSLVNDPPLSIESATLLSSQTRALSLHTLHQAAGITATWLYYPAPPGGIGLESKSRLCPCGFLLWFCWAPARSRP